MTSHAHVGVVLWSLHREALSSMSVIMSDYQINLFIIENLSLLVLVFRVYIPLMALNIALFLPFSVKKLLIHLLTHMCPGL